MISVESFYPKYPNIKTSEFDLLNPYDGRKFEDVVATKKEFSELRLEPVQRPLTEKGEQFDHQKLVARFLSSYTGYDELLLFHEMGTGKTCTAIAVVEKLRYEKDSFVNGALVFAKGAGLLKNFVQELLFVCTDGRYVPNNYETLTDLERTHRTRKIVSEFYQFFTFETFAKDLATMTDEQIRTRYENKVIVIDEVHNLREKEVDPDAVEPATAELNVYRQFYRLCHALRKRKILLMSGTPMKNGPEEFASVLNLILPDDQKFVADKEFLARYFRNDRLIPELVPEIAEKIKGRISYLKAEISRVPKIFAGEKIGELNEFDVEIDRMSEFQTKSYVAAYLADQQQRSIFNNARQASLFVFPDGSIGSEGFNNQLHVIKTTRGKRATYSMGRVLSDAIGVALRDGHEECLARLAEFSSKYVVGVRIVTRSPKSFVYCQYVTGSGAILFAMILERFGYAAANGTETTKRKRYALVTNYTSSTKNIQKVINAFNRPENVDGEYISVLVGSRVVNEGFTLKNVRDAVIFTPHWNYSETAQAIARGWRTGSHDALTARGDRPTYVVHQLVSLPRDTRVASVDLEMYETSEKKDVIMKQLERICKVAAFDCPLTVARNTIERYDGRRECDYGACDYRCAGTVGPAPDVVTYDAYYASAKRVNEYLRGYFRKNFSVRLSELRRKFDDVDNFEMLKSLSALIVNDVRYVNAFGFTCFLRLRADELYVTSDPKFAKSNAPGYVSLEDYYSRNLIIENGNSFDRIVNAAYEKTLPNKIDSIFANPPYAKSIITELPRVVQRVILEGCVLAKDRGLRRNERVRDEILEVYKGFYGKVGDVWHVWLHSDYISPTCYQNDEWVECEMPRERKEHVKSPINYYGFYNPQKNDFCVREIKATTAADLRKITVGRRCIDWEHERLVDIVAREMRIAPPRSALDDLSEVELRDQLRAYEARRPANSKYPYAKPEDYDSMGSMISVLYWSKRVRRELCDVMKRWFEERGLLEENFDCGTQKKRRQKFV